MSDPNNGPEDMYGYDEPALPYIPYGEPQDTQPYNASALGFTESLEVPQGTKIFAPGEPYAQSETLPYGLGMGWSASDGDDMPVMSTMPTMPAMPSTPVIDEAPAPPQRRSRRALWITLASVFVLLVIVGGASFALVSYLNRSTPVKTLDTFCSSLQKGDYGSAYNQFTKQLQGQFTEGDFAGLIQQNKVVSCTHGKADDAGVRVTTSLKLLHADQGVNNDLVMLTKGADSVWLINDLQKAS